MNLKLKLLSLLLLLGTITMSAQFPTTGTQKHLVLLVDFPDRPGDASLVDIMNNQYNTTKADGSISFKTFYQEMSGGKLTINTTVVGWIRMPNNYAFYNGWSSSDFSKAAIIQADPTVNFSDFAINGTVPVVTVLQSAVYGGGMTNGTGFPVSTNDGVTITSYSHTDVGTSSNYWNFNTTCHEFGHTMGLPDTYDIGGYNITRDLMSDDRQRNPSYPTHISMVHKVQLGWVTTADNTLKVLTTPGSYSITNVENTIISPPAPRAYRIDTTTPGEYYLLECRKNNDNTNGIIIWHVHKDYDANVSWPNHGWPKKLYPVNVNSIYNEPDGVGNGYNGTTAFKTGSSFTDFTKEWSRSWVDNYTEKPVTKIVINADGSATFDFMRAPNMRIDNATNVLADRATLNGKASAINGSTPTTVSFEYSLNADFSGASTVSAGPAITSTSLTSISATPTGLLANKTYYFRVKTANTYGTAYYTDAKTFYTRVITVPANESFDAALSLPTGWSESITNSGAPLTTYWKVINPGSPIGVSYQVANTVAPTGTTGTARLMSPPINTAGFSTLNLSFRYKGLPYATGFTFKVQKSTDGINWTDTGWSSTTQTTAATANITLNPTTGITYLAFVVTGNLYNCGAWYIDTFSLSSSIPTPTVTTVAANPVNATSVTLNGIANAQNSSTTVTFEWGTDTSYGNTVTAGTINGSTNTNVSATLTTGLALDTTYHFRVRAANAGGVVYGNDLTFLTPNGYCTSNGSNATRYIDGISMSGLSRTSTNDAGGYFNYIGGNASLTAGSSPALNFSQGQTDTGYWNAWIDYNGDLDFNDPGEQIITALATTGNGWFLQAFTVPTTAINGMTHMRVNLGTSNGTVLPCATGATGEVEDYRVNISNPNGRMVNNAIAETNEEIQLTKCILYPNPTRGLLNVQLRTNDPANLTIYNIAGQKLFNQAITNDQPVNVDRLNPGVYFMEISGANYIDRLQFIKE